MPAGQQSRRETTYDSMGRQQTVSELVAADMPAPLPATKMEYDWLGRVEKITAPDGALTTFTYTGNRRKKRTTSMATPGNPSRTVNTTEEYDAFGRLLAVTEPSGPTTRDASTGGDVRTKYVYDAADRLIGVTMRGAEGIAQQRVFDYDGRGFLCGRRTLRRE